MKKILTIVLMAVLCQLNAQPLNPIFHSYDNLEWIDRTVMADLNGDGLPDFIASWEVQQMLYIGINQQLESPTFTLINENNDIRGLTTADIDADGDIDIVGSAPFDNASFWWENDGAANFTKQNLSINNYEGIHFADLDGDGQMEAIISIDDGLHIYNNDKGNLTRQTTLFEDFFGDDSPAITTFDNNGDGLLDIAATFNRNGIIIYQQTENANFEEIEVISNLFNQSSLFATDFDQDGAIDFVVHSTFNGNAHLVKNNNDGTYTAEALPNVSGRNEFTTVGDIDSDEEDDILVYSESSTDNLTIFQNEAGDFMWFPLIEGLSRIETGGIIDLDGDGDNDIFVFSNASKSLVFLENLAIMTTSTTETLVNPLTIYPSFSNTFFNIQIQGTFNYQVSDVYGKIIESDEGHNTHSLNCSEWQNGTYFLTIFQEGRRQTNKLLKVD